MEWETLDDKTAWNLLAARHLSIMSLICEFKLDAPLGLARLADKGYGFYREQVSQSNFIQVQCAFIIDWSIRCSCAFGQPKTHCFG
jgi:hypothetical protein